jgi:hypothetical protein
MITLERMIQKVSPGKFPDLEELDKKFVAVETRLGFPPKKRYQCVIGGHDTNTVIVESIKHLRMRERRSSRARNGKCIRRSNERDDNRAHHYRS